MEIWAIVRFSDGAQAPWPVLIEVSVERLHLDRGESGYSTARQQRFVRPATSRTSHKHHDDEMPPGHHGTRREMPFAISVGDLHMGLTTTTLLSPSGHGSRSVPAGGCGVGDFVRGIHISTDSGAHVPLYLFAWNFSGRETESVRRLVRQLGPVIHSYSFYTNCLPCCISANSRRGLARSFIDKEGKWPVVSSLSARWPRINTTTPRLPASAIQEVSSFPSSHVITNGLDLEHFRSPWEPTARSVTCKGYLLPCAQLGPAVNTALELKRRSQIASYGLPAMAPQALAGASSRLWSRGCIYSWGIGMTFSRQPLMRLS
jgi:hypothetical protein